MISLLGDYSYTFPKPIPLKLRLKDMLEDNVAEKYYLSDKMINFFTHNEEQQRENGNGFRFNVSDGNVIAKTITTRAGSRMDDNFIMNKPIKIANLYENRQAGSIYSHEAICPTLTTKSSINWNILLGEKKKDLRIRKLTPRECGRLMGVKDEDIDKITLSDSAKYHIFGDAIVINVLMAIFKEMI